MATDADAVLVRILATQKEYEKQMAAVARSAEKAALASEKAFKSANDNMQRNYSRSLQSLDSQTKSFAARVQATFKSLDVGGLGGGGLGGLGGAKVLGGLALGAVVQQFASFADASTRVTNSLKVLGLTGQELTGIYDRLGKIAMDNGAEFEAVAKLYARVAQNQKELGITALQAEEFTRRIAVGLRASGTDAQSASAGIQQLTQALASGVLRGDEFNSVMENLPVVARAIAEGMDVPIGQLRQMATDGQLTATAVFDAFMKGSKGLDEQAKKTSMTFGQSMTNVATSMTIAVGKFNEATGAAQAFSDAMTNVVAPAIIKLGEFLAENNRRLKEFSDWLGKWTGLRALGDEMREAMEVTPDEAALKGAQNGLERLQNSQKQLTRDIAATDAQFNEFTQKLGKTNPAAANNIRNSFNELIGKLFDGQAAGKDFDKVINDLKSSGDAAGVALAGMVESFKTRFEKSNELIETLQQKILELEKRISELTGTTVTFNDQWLETAARIKAGTDALLPMKQQIMSIDEAVKSLNETLGKTSMATGGLPAPGELGGTPGGAVTGNVTFQTGEEAKTFLKQYKLEAGKALSSIEKLDDAFAITLASLVQRIPGLTIRSGWRSLEEQTYLWNKSDKTGRTVGTPEGSLHRKGLAVDLYYNGKKLTSANAGKEIVAEVQKQAGILGLNFPMSYEEWHVEPKAARTGREDDAGVVRKEKENTALTEWLSKTTEAIELKKQELAIDKDGKIAEDEKSTAKEIAKLRQDALNAAEAQYGTVSDETRAAIEERLAVMQKLGIANVEYERQQKQAQESEEERKRKIEELNEALMSMAQSAVSGFVNDLRNGVEAGEAFNNMLDRVIDGLIDLAIQALFSKDALGGLLGGGAGGATGGGGIIGTLLNAVGTMFGFAAGGRVGTTMHSDGRKAPLSLWAGAPSYATGGPVLRPGEVPIIAHQGEYVVPKNMVGAMGGGGSIDNSVHQENRISIDMSQSGAVAANTESGRQFGLNIQRMIQQELIRESRPGGLLRQTSARG